MFYAEGMAGLVAVWRDQATTLREYGAEAQAVALERCAEQLEVGLLEQRQTPLTLAEASELGGYSAEHLGRLVRQAKVPNAGRPGAPRIAREDVPVKKGWTAVVPHPQNCEIDFKQIVRSAVNEGA